MKIAKIWKIATITLTSCGDIFYTFSFKQSANK